MVKLKCSWFIEYLNSVLFVVLSAILRQCSICLYSLGLYSSLLLPSTPHVSLVNAPSNSTPLVYLVNFPSASDVARQSETVGRFMSKTTRDGERVHNTVMPLFLTCLLLK